jgi:hypothetical protein
MRVRLARIKNIAIPASGTSHVPRARPRLTPTIRIPEYIGFLTKR